MGSHLGKRATAPPRTSNRPAAPGVCALGLSDSWAVPVTLRKAEPCAAERSSILCKPQLHLCAEGFPLG